MKIIHAITDAKKGPGYKIDIGGDAKSRCGKVATVVACTVIRDATSEVGVVRYEMMDADGNTFTGATKSEIVSCKKCINLQTVGTIHARPSRPAHAAQRTVAHAKRPVGRTARAHAGPR